MNEMALQEMMMTIQNALKDNIITIDIRLHEISVVIRSEALTRVMTTLRDHKELLFKQLLDICGVDYPERPARFDVVYHLLSHKKNQRVRVKLSTNEVTPVASISDLFNAANWYEREVWDMYGVTFAGHKNLQRILTDYGFEGHPLRKDFPLTGYKEVRYDDEHKKVTYYPVQLPQDYRNFDFLSPWEGMTPTSPLLPGDEKATQDNV